LYGQSREAEQLNNGIPQSDILGDARVNGWGIFLCFRMRGSPDFVILLLQNCLQIFVVSILTTGGQMSIIGPRPALWNQDDLIEERDKYGANDVKPGLTGWAQINGRDELEIPVKAKLDGEYVKKMSFVFDCKCFLGTIKSVLKHDGVVEGGTGELNSEKKKSDSKESVNK
jgi:hypothetical protein